MSAEAMIGTGITVGALGILFLLLGWAQHMRQVKDASFTLLVIGGVLFVFGGLIALTAAGKRKKS
jgi:membrane associated rhomboid family serine protease